MARVLDTYDATPNDAKRRDYFLACVELMDQSLCSDVNTRFGPCSERDFLEHYCTAHFDKFGQEFVVE